MVLVSSPAILFSMVVLSFVRFHAQRRNKQTNRQTDKQDKTRQTGRAGFFHAEAPRLPKGWARCDEPEGKEGARKGRPIENKDDLRCQRQGSETDTRRMAAGSADPGPARRTKASIGAGRGKEQKKEEQRTGVA